jgi:hypothetical protein
MLHPSPKVEKQQLPTCSDEYTTFSTALQKVLKVSHSEMQKRITRASAARASNAKD